MSNPMLTPHDKSQTGLTRAMPDTTRERIDMAKSAKKAKIVLTNDQRAVGRAMDVLADSYAKTVSPLAMPVVDGLNKARQEWEGGAFSVMFKVTGGMTAEQLDALPDPKSDSGQNPATYYTTKIVDGKEKVTKLYWYQAMVLNFPAIRDKGKRIDQLKRSMLDPNKVNTSDIGADITNMSHDYRIAEIARLTKETNGAMTKVSNAFELYHQFRKFSELKHVEVYPIYKLGPDNLPMDGQDGRGFEIEPTQTPIVLRSTVKGREGIDTVRVSIGTFLKYDIEKAKERQGTYQAVIDTAKRAVGSDEQQGNEGNQSLPQIVNTVDTFIARAVDMFQYADKVLDEKTNAAIDALKNKTHGEGSDDAFTALRGLVEFLRPIVCSPRDDVRYQALINEERDAA